MKGLTTMTKHILFKSLFAAGALSIAGCSGGTLKSLFDDTKSTTTTPTPAAPTAVVSYAQGALTSGPFSAGDVVITVTYPANVTSIPNISIDQPGSTDITAVAMTGTVPTNVFTYTYTVNAATGGTYIDGTASVSLSSVALSSGETVSAISNNTFAISTVGPVVTGVSATTTDSRNNIPCDNRSKLCVGFRYLNPDFPLYSFCR